MSALEDILVRISSLTKEAVELQDLRRREAQERRTAIESIHDLQSRVDAEIPLSAEVATRFGARTAHLGQEGDLVLVDAARKASRRRLDSLEWGDFLAVVGECTPALVKLAQRREHEVAEKRPDLMVRISLKGGRLLIFDWRSYHLSIKSAGPEARNVRTSVEVLGTLHRFEPLNLRHDEEADLDLQRFHHVPRYDALNVEVLCTDSDGRVYGGTSRVVLEGQGWHRLPLTRMPGGPGSD